MKAVVVLDKMPKDCDDCQFVNTDDMCILLNEDVFPNKWVEDAQYYSLKEKGDCPLKLLPKHKNIYTDIDAMGWNACLNEIGGK